MKRNRRSFLKAALGCATALVVPGVLPKIIPKPVVETCTWYKPGIWAMPKPIAIDAKLLEGSIIVFETDGVVHLKFRNGSWKEEPFCSSQLSQCR